MADNNSGSGLCTVIEEVVIELKPSAPRLSVQVEVREPTGRTYVAENNTLGYPHVLWTIALAGSEEVWALDLSGAQYGWFESSIRWDDYWPERCFSDERMYTNNFGTHRTIMEKKCLSMLGKEKADHEYRSDVSDKLLYNLQRYCGLEGWTLETVLGLSEEDFSIHREEILAECNGVLQRVTAPDEQH